MTMWLNLGRLKEQETQRQYTEKLGQLRFQLPTSENIEEESSACSIIAEVAGEAKKKELIIYLYNESLKKKREKIIASYN